jgi:hypothetical protein
MIIFMFLTYFIINFNQYCFNFSKIEDYLTIVIFGSFNLKLKAK